jgi:hypothetical protein
MVSQLQAEVASQGRDPYWVFTADNGMAWGAHGFALKNVPSADRLPLYVSGPGVVDGDTSALVSNIDLAPTLAGLAGVEMTRADGISFERVLRGESGRRRALLQDHPVGGPTGLGDYTGSWWGIRTRSWHLVVWRGTHLYRTDDDRWEMVDLATEQPDTALRLARMWRRLMGPHGPARPPFPAVPVPSPSPSPTPSASSPAPSSTATPTLAPGATPSLSPSAPGATASTTATPVSTPGETGTSTPAVSIPVGATAGVTGSPGGAPETSMPTQAPIDPQRPDSSSTSGTVVLAAAALLALAAALAVPVMRRRLR